MRRGRPTAPRASGWRIAAATRPWARARGLLGRRGLAEDEGLWLPVRSVHAIGMRFALDLVWLDRTGNVARLDEDVRPGRLRTCAAARGGVIEVAAGRGRDLAAALGRQASGSWSSSRVREPR